VLFRSQRINAGPNAPRSGSTAEQSLVARAGQGGVDPNIRGQVNKDTKTLAESDKSFIDSLIFWQDSAPPGVVLDPSKEQQRIRDAQATGQPASGPTPTITRRKRGLLEGIF
jgi:hypothetical protein